MGTLLFLVALVSFSAARPLSLSNTVGSSMILQRDKPLASLWGYAGAGVVVSTTLEDGRVFNSTTGQDGIWRAQLPSMPASSVGMTITFSASGEKAITITDVVIGDVLFCSGQSNMQFSVQMAFNASAELDAIDAFGPFIRVFKAAQSNQDQPQVDVNAATPWTRASKGFAQKKKY